MEQYSQYLKWMKRKHHHILNSWQEQAFAEEDAYGPLMIWPPRSYTCTFCKREFRSAQALGGHMNVHRRDRARLNDQSQACSQTQVTTSKQNEYLSNACEAVRVVQSIEHSKTAACKNISTGREEYSRFFQGHDDNDSVETSLSVGLSFAVSSNRVAAAAMDIDGDCNKRLKTEDVSPSLPFWFKGCSTDHDKDNIDLELRLGDSPIVN